MSPPRRAWWLVGFGFAIALAGCTAGSELKVTGTRYSFTAPGRFDQVPPPPDAFAPRSDGSTNVVLSDDRGSRIYVSAVHAREARLPGTPQEPADGSIRDALWRLLERERELDGQALGRPIAVRKAGMSGLQLDGIPGRGATARTSSSVNYALRDDRAVHVISCQWVDDAKGAREACADVLSTYAAR